MARKLLPVIDPQRCTGCGRCIAVCPPHVLHLEPGPNWRKTSLLNNEAACTGCTKCAEHCPFDAITMVARQSVTL
ncbi:MAG: 4Fe-4S dicluster domain-containing protein [Proteobacteria bacterium]|nr:4Fe-4S dicluster domain-containing protein [Pseudomonadota bacterium]